jgi:hypothetical protein
LYRTRNIIIPEHSLEWEPFLNLKLSFFEGSTLQLETGMKEITLRNLAAHKRPSWGFVEGPQTYM